MFAWIVAKFKCEAFRTMRSPVSVMRRTLPSPSASSARSICGRGRRLNAVESPSAAGRGDHGDALVPVGRPTALRIEEVVRPSASKRKP